MKNKPIYILAAIGLYFVTTGLTYAGFNMVGFGSFGNINPAPTVSQTDKKQQKVDPSLPRTESCPLNGAFYTEKERQEWEKVRPLAVMIENSAEARPHSGLSRADIVYETIAEGWITRFMAVFYCNTPFENIAVAPVRSARTYFIDWVSEYDALYTHVGGANRIGVNAQSTDPRADALGQIDRYGIKDLDQFGIGYPDCYRNPDRLDHPVATEHTMVCFTENLFKIAEKRGWTNEDERGISWDKNFTTWQFKDDSDSREEASTTDINIVFAEGYDKYDVNWQYDSDSNSYKRFNGGKPHMDLETGEQIKAKNIVVQFTKLTGPIDSHGHMLYTTIGSGQAKIFHDGQVETGTWQKKSRIGRTLFYSQDNEEIEFTRGLIWIEVIPREDQVDYS